MPIYNPPLKDIDLKETRRYAGLAIANFDEQKIIDACEEMKYIAKPRGSWEIYNYDNVRGQVLSSPVFILDGSKVLKHLSHAKKVVLLAVTLGKDVEKHITETFQSGSYTHALLLDAAATSAVEQVADNLEKDIDTVIKPMGYKRVWRFSPGYGDWNIKCQPQMLALANADKIDVKNTSAMMLMPRKSVSAIIGLIPQTDPFCPDKPSCANCSQKNCPSRVKVLKTNCIASTMIK